MYRVDVKTDGNFTPRDDRKIVFHGVNKTGSLCMAHVLGESYKRHGRDDEFHCHYNSGRALGDFRSEIDANSGNGLFVGHYLYGAVDAPRADRIVVTQFRHPIPRIVSCYQWLKNKYSRKNGSAQGYPTLEEFVRRGRGKAHSQIVQFGCGFGADREQYRKSRPEEILAWSKEAIDRDVYFAGLAEWFEETAFILAHICGLPSVPRWQQDQRNTGRVLVYDLPDETVDFIKEVYRYDMELYEWIKERFMENLNEFRIGGDIETYRDDCNGEYRDRLLG